MLVKWTTLKLKKIKNRILNQLIKEKINQHGIFPNTNFQS
jgi:hypothetical protein